MQRNTERNGHAFPHENLAERIANGEFDDARDIFKRDDQ